MDIPVTNPDVVDVQFPVRGRAIPQDYADLLEQQVSGALPWLRDDAAAGIHPISGLSPGAGEWYVSRRSALTLRVRQTRAAETILLAEKRFSFAGSEVVLGEPVVRGLSFSPVIYAKFVAMRPAGGDPIDEEAFLAACLAEFERRGIQPKMVCGKPQRARTSGGLLSGFSLMLYDLETEANLQLQYEGLGNERKRGCGIFVPHKSGALAGTLE